MPPMFAWSFRARLLKTGEGRLTTATAALLLVIALVAWIGLAGPLSSATPGMSGGLLFLTGWVVMTVAMMIPASLPVLLLHRLQAARRGAGPGPTLAFLAGYLGVWSASGVAALALETAAGRLLATMAPLAAAAVLAAAGVYQLTPLKAACLRACRHPLTALFELQADAGLPGDLAGGIRHGAWCLACCWSLMAVMLLVGAMNVAWMAVLTVVFLLEKNHARGPAVARAAGLTLILLGLAGLVHPELLTWLSGGMPPTATGGAM